MGNVDDAKLRQLLNDAIREAKAIYPRIMYRYMRTRHVRTRKGRRAVYMQIMGDEDLVTKDEYDTFHAQGQHDMHDQFLGRCTKPVFYTYHKKALEPNWKSAIQMAVQELINETERNDDG